MLLVLNAVAHMATFLSLCAGGKDRIFGVIDDIVSINHDCLRGLLDVKVNLRDLDLDA